MDKYKNRNVGQKKNENDNYISIYDSLKMDKYKSSVYI